MSKRKRSRRRLSGTPADHGADALAAGGEALHQFGVALDRMEHGQCRAAFSAIEAGTASLGEAYAHNTASHGKANARYGEAAAAQFTTQRAFGKKCLIPCKR